MQVEAKEQGKKTREIEEKDVSSFSYIERDNYIESEKERERGDR